MPKLGRRHPCAVCPWLRESVRGYLGDDNPERFYRMSITQEQETPCHEQVDYTDPNWRETQLPEADFCAGSLIYFRNHMKGPRRATVAEAVRQVEPSRHVFTWPEEFIGHHMPDAGVAKVREVTSRAMWPYGSEDE